MVGTPGTLGSGWTGGGPEGRTKKPWPQVLLGSGLVRCWAWSSKYETTCAGVYWGNRWRTRATIPATWGDAWLVPQKADVCEPVSPQSAPTPSGLTRPSGVGPLLLYSLMEFTVFQWAAPTASIPGLALSAGLRMLPLPWVLYVRKPPDAERPTNWIQPGSLPLWWAISIFHLARAVTTSYGSCPASPD